MTAGRSPRNQSRGRGCGCCGGCPGCVLILALIVLTTVGIWQAVKPMPSGLTMEGLPVSVRSSDIEILADITAVDSEGRQVIHQAIFDRMLARINDARQGILVDNFFFNPITGRGGPPFRNLCGQLTSALMTAKHRHPEMPVVVITDPINTMYGGNPPSHFHALRRAGVDVVMTDLTKLRDSNSLYSAWWRVGPRWLGTPAAGGSLPNPFSTDEPPVGLRSWLALLNFKANHRKVLLTDDGGGRWVVIVGSLNAHNGSSRHSNIALEITSTEVAHQVLESEKAVLEMSGSTVRFSPISGLGSTMDGPRCEVSVVTERAVLDVILERLDQTGPGDTVDGAYFYMSHHRVRTALIRAADRGAEIRLILDPSKDAFGRTKNGIPNRQAAFNLMRHGHGRISVRWYDTHGEQFHAKMIVIRDATESTIILGSANMTRRNLDNLNLESDLKVVCRRGGQPDDDLLRWFDGLWFNTDYQATVDYEVFADPSLFRRIAADFQERTGMGTF